MSAVFLLDLLWGRGKRNKGKEWYPTHPRPTVATLPHTFYPLHLQEIDWGMCGTNCSLCCLCHKTSLYFYYKHVKQSAPWLCERTSLWSQSAPVAWHHISPCLLIGLGIYCNAIVLDGIGPVLTLMMPSSLNLEPLLLCWRPYMRMGMYGGGSGFQVEGRTPSVWPCKDNFHACDSASYLGLESWLSTTDCRELATSYAPALSEICKNSQTDVVEIRFRNRSRKERENKIDLSKCPKCALCLLNRHIFSPLLHPKNKTCTGL